MNGVTYIYNLIKYKAQKKWKVDVTEIFLIVVGNTAPNYKHNIPAEII